jgi:prepilin-type N-terminal cleavage/methylation domain-containing protein
MECSKRVKGFTLIELIIVIVIISILALVSVPIYRGYTRRAMASEGRALVGSIATSEKVYLAEHGAYLAVAATGLNAALDIDATGNKYFRTFTITQSGTVTGANATFTATATGSGDAANIVVTLVQPWAAAPTVTDTGL